MRNWRELDNLWYGTVQNWIISVLKDKEINHPNDQSIEKIVKIFDRGVDGILTDRPACFREVIDRWKKER
jgi:hypothetical protein